MGLVMARGGSLTRCVKTPLTCFSLMMSSGRLRRQVNVKNVPLSLTTNMYERGDRLWLRSSLARPPQSLSSLALSSVLFLPPQLCIQSPVHSIYLYHSFVLAYSRTALISSPTASPNLATCSGLDELVAHWNKPVCLLYKPMFQAYAFW